MSKTGLILFFSIVSISRIAAQTILGLSLPEQSNGVVHLDVSGILDDKKQEFNYDFLSVFVANETDEYTSTVPMQGNFSLAENNLIFKPYFPFEKGLPYIVKLKKINSDEVFYIPFQIGEKEKIDQAVLLNIFPTAHLLPENLLRFYFYFKTPMKQEVALKHIKLVDEEGNIDDHAFMKFKEELWSNDGKRLTLLFDPGRIKRGVSTNVKQGTSLEQGKRYHLTVSEKWQDVYGQNLSKNTAKEIIVVAPYRKRINIDEWILNKPKFDSLDKLKIHFDRIIDHALIQSMMQIRDGSGKRIDGSWKPLDNEQQVQFVPQEKWGRGSYTIEIDTRIEDVSGNNLQHLLDYHIMEQGDTKKMKFINFTIL